MNIQLFKNDVLLGSQDVLFSIFPADAKKTKNNNEFKKWLTFNLSSNNANTNSSNNVTQNPIIAKSKDGKRNSLTGVSLLNFNEFVKIHFSISKADEGCIKKIKFLEKNEKEEETIYKDTEKAADKKEYINIQENEENAIEIIDNTGKEIMNENTVEDDQLEKIKENLIDKKNVSSKGHGKNRSIIKKLHNSILDEGKHDVEKEQKLKDSAKSKKIYKLNKEFFAF